MRTVNKLAAAPQSSRLTHNGLRLDCPFGVYCVLCSIVRVWTVRLVCSIMLVCSGLWCLRRELVRPENGSRDGSNLLPWRCYYVHAAWGSVLPISSTTNTTPSPNFITRLTGGVFLPINISTSSEQGDPSSAGPFAAWLTLCSVGLDPQRLVIPSGCRFGRTSRSPPRHSQHDLQQAIDLRIPGAADDHGHKATRPFHPGRGVRRIKKRPETWMSQGAAACSKAAGSPGKNGTERQGRR